ncbi:hypothetical protein Tco_0345586 [Tanacetum coccineum]
MNSPRSNEGVSTEVRSRCSKNCSYYNSDSESSDSNASTTIVKSAPTPTTSSTKAPFIPKNSQDVDELQPQPQHVQQQDNQPLLQSEAVAEYVENAMVDENTFINTFAPASTSSAESSS